MATDANRVKKLFAAVLELADLEDRQVFLDRECEGDTALRHRLDALLRAHDNPESALERPLAAASEPELTGAFAHSNERPGALVAEKYKLLESIGEGGMGEVWVAMQTQPVRRKVALKLIKAGMDSKSVLARFEAERQALALMDHPNIARVLDAGTTAEGRPYFAMELVKGTPITEFCDARKLSPRQRLELFVPVCQAIQHAHTKGIIHRDIKPSNVLVALHDEKPVAKVIDFGVAKAIGQQLTEKTIHTGFGALIGTPAYMSPEQATFNQLDVDTRSDVYSLGVLLYELLAGSPPFKPARLKKVALDEVLRLVREEEPPKPSARLSTSKTKATIAAERRSDPGKLTKLIRGELDWIVMKALDKDRTRRYETANGFAMDVQRYLAGDRVLAVPPSSAYRLRKFLRRNRGATIAASVVTLVLLTGTVATAWQATVARNNLKQTQETQRDMREALKTLYAANIEDLMSRKENLTETDQKFIADMQMHYAKLAQAKGDSDEALEIRLDGLLKANYLSQLFDRKDQRVDEHREAVAIARSLVERDPVSVELRDRLASALSALTNLLGNISTESAVVERDKLLSEQIAIVDALAQEQPANSRYASSPATTRINFSNHCAKIGGLERAESLLRESIAISERNRQLFPEQMLILNHLESACGNLAILLDRLPGHEAEAEDLHKRALELTREAAGKGPYHILQRNLADKLLSSGQRLYEKERLAEAKLQWSEAVEIYSRYFSDYPSQIPGRQVFLKYCRDIAQQVEASQDWEAALEWHRRANEQAKLLLPNQFKTVTKETALQESLRGQSRALMNLHRPNEAKAILSQAQEIVTKQNKPLEQIRLAGDLIRTRQIPEGVKAVEKVLNTIKQPTPEIWHEAARSYTLAAQLSFEVEQVRAHLRRAVECFNKVEMSTRFQSQFEIDVMTTMDLTCQLLLAWKLDDLVIPTIERMFHDVKLMVESKRVTWRTTYRFTDLVRFLLEKNQPDKALELNSLAIAMQKQHQSQDASNLAVRALLDQSFHTQTKIHVDAARFDQAIQVAQERLQNTFDDRKPFVKSWLAVILIEGKKVDEAKRLLKDLRPTSWNVATTLYNLACAYSLLAGQETTAKEELRTTAIGELRQAMDAGFRDLQQLKSDPHLKGLRDRDDFKQIITDLEAKLKK